MRDVESQADVRAIKDALDTAADVLLPDSLFGPVFSKADAAVRRLARERHTAPDEADSQQVRMLKHLLAEARGERKKAWLDRNAAWGERDMALFALEMFTKQGCTCAERGQCAFCRWREAQ
jgi:hypothetical protein